MTDFWTRFNAMAAEAELTETGKLFVADNFHVGHNGGGTSAWEKPVDDTPWKVLITDTSGSDHVSEDGKWLVGVHSDEGEFADSAYEAVDIADALRAADILDKAISASPSLSTVNTAVETLRLGAEDKAADLS
ncbi:hypothetical protein [Rhizobium wenxiniae]|uniref:hypothetical protein n=1 Tax=Rhizobium wenxiniae TaxID=1737357 RepID=UPI003C188426